MISFVSGIPGLWPWGGCQNVKSCGTKISEREYLSIRFDSSGTSSYSNPFTSQLLEWADMIICMESCHKKDIIKKCPSAKNKDIRVLGIEDKYGRNDDVLVDKLKKKLGEHIEL